MCSEIVTLFMCRVHKKGITEIAKQIETLGRHLWMGKFCDLQSSVNMFLSAF